MSQGDRISLSWDSSDDEGESWFEGYRIYRAQGDRYDSTYIEIADLNKTDGTLSNEYFDLSAVRGQSYYYTIIAYDDGSRNTIEPGIPLYSSPHLTRTNSAASLKKPASDDMSEIRVVPNPYNISNVNYQYSGEPNKIMFVNLPNECKIKIFTERGDLIYEADHIGSGDRRWDLITSSRQIVVSGVYIATFEWIFWILVPFFEKQYKEGYQLQYQNHHICQTSILNRKRMLIHFGHTDSIRLIAGLSGQLNQEIISFPLVS